MQSLQLGQIHPTAVVSPDARVGRDVTIGPYAVVHDGVEIGDGTLVGSHCVLGEPLATFYDSESYQNPPAVIGPRAVLRSGTIVYAGASLGEEFECGHRVTIREGATFGRNCRVGTLSDIQGDCSFGEHTRLHSNVHVGQRAKIGNFVWIFPYTVLTNDPHPPSNQLVGVTVEDYAVIATMCVILPGVVVGTHALVGACTLVREDVPSHAVVVGNPGKQVATVDRIRNRFTGEPVYPWPEHFERGMPWADVGYRRWAASQT